MASELIVQTIQGPSSGANANKVIIPSGHTLDASGGTLVPSAGAVVQMQSALIDYVVSGSASFVSLGSVTITPAYSDSKILIMFENHIYVSGLTSDSWRGANIRLLRGSTFIYGDDSNEYGEAAYLVGDSDRYMTYSHRHYIDQPNTTSATTYNLEGYSKDGLVDIHYNRSTYGAQGRITAMEIKQ